MSSTFSKARNAWTYLREHGPKEFLDRLRFGPPRDLSKQYSYTLLGPYPRHPQTDDVSVNTINWFLSGFSATSGGHINIMRFVQGLEALGYECRIVFGEGRWMGDPDAVQQRMVQAFGPMQAKVYLDAQAAPPAYACVATGFDTAYYVRAFTSTHKRFYFVQDYEPWFSAPGSEFIFAENTYRFGFIGLTAGSWLADKLHAEFGMETHPFAFSYDAKLYQPLPRQHRTTKRIFFYARPETERRAFELGVLALHCLHQLYPNIEVVFAGGNLERQKFAFPHQICGKLRVSELGALYNSCDAALVLSMTNLSLLPLELMACGTPVVSNMGPWAEWQLNPSNAKLAEPNPQALAAALVEVINNPAEWKRLHQAGLATVAGSSWEAEAKKVADALRIHDCKA
ncbi:hypothetical protein CHU94_18370 [Rhodoferax sp. TH121]|uniref:glycosyltransferase family 4 protein n=1 Tax=Rhodoferax sp. TH121 TaxID=2022803 RepID=UPI000B975F80|nr:glycosyltransferase family 4 protein [Rhodoferax sp. TH121]OYQ39339.1 hypothetical protein CHU94_18370 [Rhodoferax sp. TH121]